MADTDRDRKEQARTEMGMPTLSSHDRAIADLYRGGPDDVRGNAKAVYRLLHPRAKDRTAEVEASRILRKPEVREYLAERAAQSAEQANITEEQVLRDLQHMAAMALGKVPTPHTVVVEGEAVALQIRKVNFQGAGKALELLGKRLGLWTDNHRVQHGSLEDLLQAIQGSEKNTPMARLRAREQRDGRSQI